MNVEDGGPAFPTEFDAHGWHGLGMSLRDHFAATALPLAYDLTRAAVKNGSESITPQNFAPLVANGAYAIADAMLKERAQ